MDFEQLFYLVGNIIGGAALGCFCGITPMILGIVKKKYLLGILGMLVCVVFATVCTTLLSVPGFLSIIPATIFTLVIIFMKKKK